MRALVAASLSLLVVACDSGGGGGTRQVAPETPDAASPPGDAAARDVGATTDAEVRDAGPTRDQGLTLDATAPDALPPDAGPSPAMFAPGPYGTGFRDVAGPFTVETTAGPWDFEAEYTGRDSYLFSFFTDDPRQSADLIGFLNALWFGGAADQRALLESSPPDVHYFFGSYDGDAADDVTRLEADFATVLAGLPAESAAHWQGRLHFITEPLPQTQGWLRQVLQANSWLWFGIDPTQHMRQLGIPADIATGRPRLMQLAFEAKYFAFEQAREASLVWDDAAAETAIDVPLFRGEHIGTAVAEVELPPPEVMAGFDTLLIDLTAHCPEHKDENCGEWDYLSGLQVCDRPVVPGNPHAAEACQPAVPEVPAVVEVLGACVGGAAPDAAVVPADAAPPAGDAAVIPAPDAAPPAGDAAVIPAPDAAPPLPAGCRADADCAPGARCEGYIAPVEGVAGVPADTRTCECSSPFGTSREGTHTCTAEGTGFSACNCPCDAELGRWVTTYGREGRWVTDASPLLSLLREGGAQRLLMQSGNAYDMTLTLRLGNRGKGAHPAEIVPLWRGGGFGPEYNTGRAPHRFTVPEGVTRVELVAFITGHGWGQDRENCAEFCNHTHHFTLNGHEHVRSNEVAGTATGCQDQVDRGVVPNQYGTWPFGRSGWCPGLDVPAYVVDLTADVIAGENELTYRGLFDGVDYVPRPPVNGNPQGFGAQINLTSYLVYWR